MAEMSSKQIERRAKYLSTMDPNTIFMHDGKLFFNNRRSLDWLLAIKDLTVRPTDIWICGYQKSGNTWLSGIVSLIMADGVVDRVKDEYIRERVPNIFTPTTLSKISGLKPQSVEWFDGLKDPRIINSHLDVKLSSRFENCKMIYIMRNPKDVCVSYYYYQKMMKRTDIDFEDTCQLFLDENLINGDWFQHLRDYWLTYGLNHPNVLFVAYEELCADLPAMVRTIARFLGKHFADETVDTIVSHTKFEAMKGNPIYNQFYLLGKNAPQFVRNGTIGDWRAHMTDRQSALFDERYGQRLRAIGLRVCDNMEAAERCMATTGRIIECDKN